MKDVSKGELFKDIVSTLEQAGQKLCILHGYKDYPEHIDSDVDAISDSAAEVPRALSGGKTATVVQAIRTHPTAAFWYVLQRWDGDKLTFIRLHVFHDDYRINGRTFFRGKEFLESCRPFKFFKIPPPDLEFAAYLVKKLHKGSLDEIQGQRLSELYDEDPAGCKRRLARLFPETDAKLLEEAARSGDWESVRGRVEHLRRKMMEVVDREQPLEVLRNRLDDFWRRARRVLQPSGAMVAVLGVDGAGKSTVMAGLERDLAPAFWSTKQYHGRALESPLRWTRRVRKQREQRRREVESAATAGLFTKPSRDPHDKPSRGLALSLVKLGIYWMDYTFLGYLLDIYPQLRRTTLVLLDRHYQDLLVDPKRHRYGGPLWLARLVGRLLPQPHLVVLLDAPPEMLHARKQEVSLAETSRQREAYLELVRDSPNGYLVDASKPPDEVRVEVEKIILDYLAKRTARRSKH